MEGMTSPLLRLVLLRLLILQAMYGEEVTVNVQLPVCVCSVCLSKPSPLRDGSGHGPALCRGLPAFQPFAPLFLRGWLSLRCFGFTLVG